VSICARVEALLRACVIACVATASARAGDDAQDHVRELLGAHELGRALVACDAITDPVLRAEWRFAVLYAGGDLSGALDAALAGLGHSPGQAGLAHNALICSLRLRAAEVASKVRAQLPATPAELAPDLDRLAELERSAVGRTQRARGVVLTMLLASAFAIVAFARRPTAR
jgi:hypothetical protein